MRRVFEKASEKLGPRLEHAGTVPPRVLKAVLDEGQFAEDELMAEYLGGVLASARSEDGRDDRAASDAATIGRLSTYALRTHYILYAAARPLFLPEVDFGLDDDRGHVPIFVSAAEFKHAMDLLPLENAALRDIVNESLFALTRENLIGVDWEINYVDGSRAWDINDPRAGIAFRLEAPGILLFCAAHGFRDNALTRFTREDFGAVTGITVPNAVVVG